MRSADDPKAHTASTGIDAPHSIGEAARAAGLTPQALRMWEERYGRPVAVRLPSGHRRYTDEQVRWLRRVGEALAQGHRAGAVVPLHDDELTALLSRTVPGEALGEGPRAMLGWLATYRADEIRAWLEARWDPDAYLDLLREEVAPLVVAVGRRWADGELGVSHEHLLSQLLEDELRRLRSGFSPAPGAPAVLCTTLRGERHGLGLQMVALGAAAHGLTVHMLGVDTPLESIVNAARELRPRVVAVSVSAYAGGMETWHALSGLRTSLPASIRVVAGGAGMRRARRKPRGVECLNNLSAWDRFVAALAHECTGHPVESVGSESSPGAATSGHGGGRRVQSTRRS